VVTVERCVVCKNWRRCGDLDYKLFFINALVIRLNHVFFLLFFFSLCFFFVINYSYGHKYFNMF